MAADEGIGYFKRRLVLTIPSMGRVGAHRATGGVTHCMRSMRKNYNL